MKKKKPKQRQIGVYASNGKMYCLVKYVTNPKKDKDGNVYVMGYKIEETTDENFACYVIRNGAQRDAYICPWCYFSKQKNFNQCLGMAETWIIRLQYELQTKNGFSKVYLEGYQCEKTNKYFLVEARKNEATESQHCKINKDGSERYTCPVCNSQLPEQGSYCYKCYSHVWLVSDENPTSHSDFMNKCAEHTDYGIGLCLDNMCTRGGIYNPHK